MANLTSHNGDIVRLKNLDNLCLAKARSNLDGPGRGIIVDVVESFLIEQRPAGEPGEIVIGIVSSGLD